MFKDTSIIKQNVINFLENNGPSLPVHISRYIKVDMLFTSAFLSELTNQGKIKHSFMRVGTSPIYFLPEKEKGIEKFSEYLKSKEKEAFKLIEEKKFLIDEEQETAMQVALKEIKDFAIPFEKKGKLIWRYFLTPEEDYLPEKEEQEIINKEIPELKEEALEIKKELKEKIIEEENEIIKEEKIKKIVKKRTPQKKKGLADKKNEKFFNTVKEHLTKKEILITDFTNLSNKELILKINHEGDEKLLVAYNKKRITEADILNAYKKASEYNLNFIIFSLGEPTKKMQNIIEASKKLSSIEKIE